MIERPLRFVLRRCKALLKENATVRSLLADISNTEEFGHLHEHEIMVADSIRVNAYRDAIARHVRPDDAVVDVGTGTGVLALFAARRHPRKLYAIDHSPFIEIAKRIATHNGVSTIDFVRTNSRSFEPNEKLDLIIHEQLGDDLFDENMLENLLDLKRRVLKPSGRILPGRFELFLEPASVKPEFRVPRLAESKVHGIDFSCLRGMDELVPYLRPDYDHAYLRTGAFGHFLCDPRPVLTVNLNRMQDPDELTRSFEAVRTVVRPGRFDGLCLYFRVIFDDQISFETSPAEPRTHWANRLFRAEGRDCVPGDILSYRFSMRDPVDVNTWTVAVETPRAHRRLAEDRSPAGGCERRAQRA
jgi:protein arginine N-methyltransferase 1